MCSFCDISSWKLSSCCCTCLGFLLVFADAMTAALAGAFLALIGFSNGATCLLEGGGAYIRITLRLKISAVMQNNKKL